MILVVYFRPWDFFHPVVAVFIYFFLQDQFFGRGLKKLPKFVEPQKKKWCTLCRSTRLLHRVLLLVVLVISPLLSATFWTSRSRRCRPFFPLVRAFIVSRTGFIQHLAFSIARRFSSKFAVNLAHSLSLRFPRISHVLRAFRE